MQTIVELIEACARDAAGEVFLTSNGEAITFAALHERVRRAAAMLRAAGLAAEHRVLVMAPNSPDHVVLYLALAWIGCVVIEASVFLKASGLALQLEDADPHAAIVHPAFADEMRAAIGTRDVRLLTLAALDLSSGDPGKGDPLRATLARVQSISYTSGTTGRPKGVVMTER